MLDGPPGQAGLRVRVEQAQPSPGFGEPAAVGLTLAAEDDDVALEVLDARGGAEAAGGVEAPIGGEVEVWFALSSRTPAPVQPDPIGSGSMATCRYCDLLMRDRPADVRHRAQATLLLPRRFRSLQGEALSHLLVGRAALATAAHVTHPDFALARRHLDAAVAATRRAGREDHQPRALLARSTHVDRLWHRPRYPSSPGRHGVRSAMYTVTLRSVTGRLATPSNATTNVSGACGGRSFDRRASRTVSPLLVTRSLMSK